MDKSNSNALIIGAGPSGLALAYELIELNSDIKPVVIDKLPVVGGLSRTVYDGKFGIDIGGHRLFTKDKYVESIWKKFLKIQNAPAVDDFLAHRDIKYPELGADPNFADDVLLIRKRFSSILKNNKRINYPIRLNYNTFRKLGFVFSIRALFSYIKALFLKRPENNVEDFLINRFGYFIYRIFFKKHTKKVWGLDASNLYSEWNKNRVQKSLFALPKLWEDEYYYPKFGCSQLWNKMARYITDNGGTILLNCEFKDFNFNDNKIISANVIYDGKIIEIPAKYFISSIPLCDLIKTVEAPFDVKQNALNLKYRDYILVSLFTKEFNLLNNTKYPSVNDTACENWIYLQDNKILSSRMQIMNNWSPYLVDDCKNNYIISLEYFCNQGDNLWNMSDDELINLAVCECEKLGFFTRYNVFASKVIKELKAYPVYCGSYKNIQKIRDYLKNYTNLYIMGRNGEHKYINMDSAMVCGINIARDINKKDI